MSKFKAGDKVVRKNGLSFSNDQKVVTVERVAPSTVFPDKNLVWLKETNSHISEESIEWAPSDNYFERVIAEVEERRAEKFAEYEKLQDEINKLDHVIDTLKEVK